MFVIFVCFLYGRRAIAQNIQKHEACADLHRLYILKIRHDCKKHLSYDVASGSEITPYNKIDKPLVVYRFTGNVLTSITTLRT